VKPHPFSHFRRTVIRGLMIVLPLLITLWLLGILFRVIDDKVTPLVRGVLVRVGISELEVWFLRFGIPIIGLLLTVGFVYLLGLLGGNLGGRRFVSAIESYILRIPVVRSIYGSARQLLDAFSVTGRQHFSRVVLVEYPRRGIWTVGFVTRESRHAVPRVDSRSVPVFMPTTPNPTSGWMALVPVGELIELEMSIEDGLKLVVSGGIVSPENLGAVVSEPRMPEGGR